MSDALNYLVKARPDAVGHYFAFLKACGTRLDPKTRNLITVITKVHAQTERGFRQYLGRALREGCTPAEVLDALLMAFPSSAWPGSCGRSDLILAMDLPHFQPAAMGADALSRARALLAIVNRENPGLVILGKQAIDDDNSQTGQMLAALWNRPQATFASKLELNGDSARVVREVDVGLETIEIDLPAVITTDLRLNEPRYVKLPDIMKAKKKPLDEIALADLGITAGPALQATLFEPPAERQKGVMVDDVAGLIAALKDKGLL